MGYIDLNAQNEEEDIIIQLKSVEEFFPDLEDDIVNEISDDKVEIIENLDIPFNFDGTIENDIDDFIKEVKKDSFDI